MVLIAFSLVAKALELCELPQSSLSILETTENRCALQSSQERKLKHRPDSLLTCIANQDGIDQLSSVLPVLIVGRNIG